MRILPRWRFVFLAGLVLGCRHPSADQGPGPDSPPAPAAADPANLVVATPPVDSAVDTAADASLRDFLPDGIEIRAGDSTLDERTVEPRSDFNAATTALLYFRVPPKLPVGTQLGVAGHHHCEISRAESDAVPVIELGLQLSTEGVSLGGVTGFPEPGNWFPGHYRIACSVDGRVIGSNFRVAGLPMKTNQNWVGHIAALADRSVGDRRAIAFTAAEWGPT